MSGGLIASAVATHSPRMAIEETAPDFVRGLIAGSREMGEAVRGLDPDLIVLQSAHWVSTFNWYVTAHAVHEGVCMAEEAPDLIPGIPYRRPGDPEFAGALAEALKDAGLPCGINQSPHYHWDYASLVPLLYLDAESTLPVVTLPTVTCAELDENIAVGRLVGDAAAATGRRCVFISSCALSHKVVRGPELWPSEEMQALDHRVVDLMRAGKAGELVAWAAEYSAAAVAEMGGRTICGMIGAMDAMDKASGPLEGRQYGPYGQSSGSGNANVCVTPKAA